MELTDRKLKILQAIISDYVRSAEPVGSRTLSKRFDLGISPATIRNEMSDLEENHNIYEYFLFKYNNYTLHCQKNCAILFLVILQEV